MIEVIKYFIDRDTMKEYHAGDEYPRDGVSSERIAELVSKGYLEVKEDAPKVEAAEKKPAAKKARAKKG